MLEVFKIERKINKMNGKDKTVKYIGLKFNDERLTDVAVDNYKNFNGFKKLLKLIVAEYKLQGKGLEEHKELFAKIDGFYTFLWKTDIDLYNFTVLEVFNKIKTKLN